MKCKTCGQNIVSNIHYSNFLCPNCQETEIIRCGRCKKIAIPYVCEKCKFIGP